MVLLKQEQVTDDFYSLASTCSCLLVSVFTAFLHPVEVQTRSPKEVMRRGIHTKSQPMRGKKA